MPSSIPQTIPVVIDLIWLLKPMAVVDLGCGYGKYGTLFREYLGLRHREGRDGVHARGAYADLKNGKVRVDAVEGWAPYVGELHSVVYDNVYIENIVAFCQRPWEVRYDFVF